MSEPVAVERLRKLLSYDPETGNCTWRAQVARNVRVGDIAGSIYRNGYRNISIDNCAYGAHRVIWAHVTGEWPQREIDHTNGDKADNRWHNLREATKSQNQANRPRRPNNTSGFPGVDRRTVGGKWRACGKVYGKKVMLGRFDTRHQAYAAHCIFTRKHQGEYARCYDDDIMIELGPQSLGNDWLGI